MRISDWSSDVCSSDLPALIRIGAQELRGQQRAAIEAFPLTREGDARASAIVILGAELAAERCILTLRIICETVRARGAGVDERWRRGVGVQGRQPRETLAGRRPGTAAGPRPGGVRCG